MVGWHYQLNGLEFEQTPGNSEGQGSLECCHPWGRRIRYNLAAKQQQKYIFRILFPSENITKRLFIIQKPKQIAVTNHLPEALPFLNSISFGDRFVSKCEFQGDTTLRTCQVDRILVQQVLFPPFHRSLLSHSSDVGYGHTICFAQWNLCGCGYVPVLSRAFK